MRRWICELAAREMTVASTPRMLLELMNGPMPKPIKIPICKGCTNKDWCWA